MAQLSAVFSLLDPFFGDLVDGFRRRFSSSVLAVAVWPDLLRTVISVALDFSAGMVIVVNEKLYVYYSP